MFAVVTFFSFFAALELGLAFLGVRPQLVTEDPFIGFSQRVPLMEIHRDSLGSEIVSVATNKLTWFNAQSFPRKKGLTTRRIFSLGGSTTYGHPYWDSTSFSRWLREFLPVVDSEHSWEVINCGGISYASYRVANIVEELTQFEPDLFVIYSVHNEFLERRTYAKEFTEQSWLRHVRERLAPLRTYAVLEQTLRPKSIAKSEPGRSSVDLLPAEVDEMLNHTAGPLDYHRDPQWQAGVLMHYEQNLRRMISLARSVGAEIVFVTPTSNERDCSPFKVELHEGLSEEQRLRFEECWKECQTYSGQQRWSEVLEVGAQGISIDPLHAGLLYEMGRAAWELGDSPAATDYFCRARDEDVCPLRATTRINQAVRRVCSEQKVMLVDFEAKLREKSQRELGHSVFGNEYFLDHVHPTIDIQRHLALWLIAGLLESGFLSGSSLEGEPQASRVFEITEQVLAELDHEAQGVGLRNLAKVLHWGGKFAEGAHAARQALELIENDAESLYVLADCLHRQGNNREAIEQYQKLFERDVTFPRAHLRFGLVLAIEGDVQRSREYLLVAAMHDPDNGFVHAALGKVQLFLGETESAVASLREAVRLDPKDLDAKSWLEIALAER